MVVVRRSGSSQHLFSCAADSSQASARSSPIDGSVFEEEPRGCVVRARPSACGCARRAIDTCRCGSASACSQGSVGSTVTMVHACPSRANFSTVPVACMWVSGGKRISSSAGKAESHLTPTPRLMALGVVMRRSTEFALIEYSIATLRSAVVLMGAISTPPSSRKFGGSTTDFMPRKRSFGWFASASIASAAPSFLHPSSPATQS
mmetsp:Transcript_18719/g.60142  ORF Transcript_18719/g.60142 Transcript_18719/m.60142 type:complete len:205 (+) Transcript_18719:69-683(+)